MAAPTAHAHHRHGCVSAPANAHVTMSSAAVASCSGPIPGCFTHMQNRALLHRLDWNLSHNHKALFSALCKADHHALPLHGVLLINMQFHPEPTCHMILANLTNAKGWTPLCGKNQGLCSTIDRGQHICTDLSFAAQSLTLLQIGHRVLHTYTCPDFLENAAA